MLIFQFFRQNFKGIFFCILDVVFLLFCSIWKELNSGKNNFSALSLAASTEE